MLMNKITSIFLAVALFALASCQDKEEAILKRVDAIYSDVAAGQMDSYELSNRYCSSDWNKTVALVDEYDRKHNEGMLGFFEYDYWVQGQDVSEFHISDLALESLEGDTATVSFKLYNFGSATPMRLKLVKEKGSWQIDDFISLGEYPTDLKAAMQEYIKE